MAKILIKNGRVWNGEEFSYADVLTDGDRIAKIEQNITDDANYVYDASEKIVSAGIICSSFCSLHRTLSHTPPLASTKKGLRQHCQQP